MTQPARIEPIIPVADPRTREVPTSVAGDVLPSAAEERAAEAQAAAEVAKARADSIVNQFALTELERRYELAQRGQNLAFGSLVVMVSASVGLALAGHDWI